jgi:hypothetical protein
VEQIPELAGSAQATSYRSVQAGYQQKEAVMDDRQKDEARTPQTPPYVNDLQLHRVLDESLWQVERRRVAPSGSPDKNG